MKANQLVVRQTFAGLFLLRDRLIYFTVAFAIAVSLPSVVAQDASPRTRISDLRDTFWHPKQLEESAFNDSSQVVSIIVQSVAPDGAHGAVTFSTPAYFISFPLFINELNGLEFSSAFSHGGLTKDRRFPQDERAGQMFGSALKKTCCYELSSGVLTLMDRERHPLIVLIALQQEGIENQRWRIVKYHDPSESSTPKNQLIDAKEQADVTLMNGRVYGSPGCGGWDGTYAVSGDKLTSAVDFDLAGLCSSVQLTQGFSVVRALKGDRRIEKVGDDILLRDDAGNAMLLLVPFWPR